MGCDIHMILETKPAGSNQFQMVGKMEHEEGYMSPTERYSGRNYNLFAALADVRNGSGFAGCDTGDRIQPIAPPRGVPADASQEYKDWVKQWGSDGHSHSYHTLTDLLKYDWTGELISRGWVDLETYDQWRGYWEKQGDSPKSWCGDVGGGRTRKISRAEADLLLGTLPNEYNARQAALKLHNHIYTQVQWGAPVARAIGNEFWYAVLAPMLKLAQEHGSDNVRAIFFFDN